MLFTNALEKVFRPSNHKNRRGAENAPKTRKLQLESLETRQLLAVLYVDSLADPGVSGDTQTTLREAIAQANPGDVINNDRGDDLAGNYRLKGAATPYNVDAGAYSGGVIPQVSGGVITVTIEDDGVNNDGEIDHSDDFNADGSPNIISLREAYDRIGGGFNEIRFASGVKKCRLVKEIVSEKTYTIDEIGRAHV